MDLVWTNWSGHQQCRPRGILRPASEDELADLVQRSAPVVRAAGAGHSFSAIVPTNDILISLEKLTGIQSVDLETRQIKCGAGTPIRELGQPLHRLGLALRNQGDVDAQTLAGACATGTHGTGLNFGCLATDLLSFRLVTATGEILECDGTQNTDLFDAGRVSLGALGVLSQVTVQCCEAFSLHERLGLMDLEECLNRAQELAEVHRHFEFFHFPYADRVLVKTMNATETPAGLSMADQREDMLFRWACDLVRLFPSLIPFVQRTAMRWYPGRERRDLSYRVFPSARTVRFNEMEYEVPVEVGVACYREIVELLRRERMAVCFPLEFRRVKGDALWLSPFFGRDSVSISVHQHHRELFEPLFRLVEPVFWRYEGRPHWGKLHTLSASRLRGLYPRWSEFTALRERLDPQGKFLNPHLRQLLAPERAG